MRIEPGQILHERWRIDRMLGEGGMGYVVEGEDLLLQRRAAIKTLHPEHAGVPQIHERFLTEARALARIDATQVVSVYDAFEWKGLPVVVMEYADGETLADVLSRDPRPSFTFVRAVIDGVLRGLKAAHREGVVHRDVKPSNIMVVHGEDGEVDVRLLDFGAALVQRELRHTRSGSMVGTIRYMSPEQVRGSADVDDRTDLFSTGVVLWEMLSGTEPWADALDDFALRSAVVEGSLPPLPADVPRDLVQRVNRLTQKDPAARPQHAAEVLGAPEQRELEGARPTTSSRRAKAHQRGGHHAPAEGPETELKRFKERARTWVRASQVLLVRHWPKLVLGVGVLVVLVAAGFAGTWWWAEHSRAVNERLAAERAMDEKWELLRIRGQRAFTGEMQQIRAGTFRMGSPPSEQARRPDEDQVEVRLTHGFELGRYPVTQALFENVMDHNPSGFPACGGQCPVENITWLDAVRFTNRLNEVLALPPCYDHVGEVIGGDSVYACEGFRLPTEAEWEYAVRAGGGGPRYGSAGRIAWYARNSGGTTHRVGQKEPNDWGLHDMFGNVWEWTHDRYAEELAGGIDPEGPQEGTARVVRGGSFDNEDEYLRAAYRLGVDARAPSRNDGFRLARTSH